MKKYYIEYEVTGTLTIEVNADSEEEAYLKAEQKFEAADLNNMVVNTAYIID